MFPKIQNGEGVAYISQIDLIYPLYKNVSSTSHIHELLSKM